MSPRSRPRTSSAKKVGRSNLRPTLNLFRTMVRPVPRSFLPERLGEAALQRPEEIGERGALAGRDQDVRLHARLDLLGDIFRHGAVVNHDLCSKIGLLLLLLI